MNPVSHRKIYFSSFAIQSFLTEKRFKENICDIRHITDTYIRSYLNHLNFVMLLNGNSAKYMIKFTK